MKLTKSEAQIIANNYSLGKVKKVTYFKEGYINYNFLIETNLGKYVFVVFGHTYNKWKKQNLKDQFNVLNYLKKNKFPYEIPAPLKNKNKSYLSRFKGKPVWAYKFIEGKTKIKENKKDVEKIAKLAAIYYQYMRKFVSKKSPDKLDYNWLIKYLKKLKKRPSKNKIDKLFHKNVDFFLDILGEFKDVKFYNFIFTHSDFKGDNVIFKDSEIIGVIDFDNIEFHPRAIDVAYTVKRIKYLGKGYSKKKLNVFLKAYEKISPLSKKEKETILPLVLMENASEFWWTYDLMRKNRHEVYGRMLKVIRDTENLYKELK